MTARRTLTNIVDLDDYAALSNPAAATVGLRSLGTAAANACAGDDARLTDARPPSGAAGGDLAGGYPAPTVAAGKITASKIENGGNAASGRMAQYDGAALQWVDVRASDLPGLVAPCDPRQATAVQNTNANTIRGCRVVCPRKGVLTDLAVFIGTESGNIDAAVYDTGDTLAGSRSQLWHLGSTVCPAGGWAVLGTPGVTVTAGQQLDFAFIADNASVTIARTVAAATNMMTLPTNFWPAAGGAAPKLSWSYAPGGFTMPATIAEASLAPGVYIAFIMARVV